MGYAQEVSMQRIACLCVIGVTIGCDVTQQGNAERDGRASTTKNELAGARTEFDDIEGESGIEGDSDIDAGTDGDADDTDEVLSEVQINEFLVRQVTSTSLPPTTEIETDEGNYVAIWVHDDGHVAIAEWVPEGGQSAVADDDLENITELFLKIAGPAEPIPPALLLARPFAVGSDSVSEFDDDQPVTGVKAPDPEPVPLTGAACSMAQQNGAFDGFRPGVFGSESDTEFNYYGSPNINDRAQPVLESTRNKWLTDMFQTGNEQWTPERGTRIGGLYGYLRASATACDNNFIRMTGWECVTNPLTTGDYGCGKPGSNIFQTHGPFVYSSGTTWIALASNPGDYVLRMRLDNMTPGTDVAVWAYINASFTMPTINDCFY